MMGGTLIETLVDTLGYDIEPEYLFNVLTDQAKQNTFQLNELNNAFMPFYTKSIPKPKPSGYVIQKVI